MKSKRISLLRSVLDCLSAENTESVYKAMINQRNRIRRLGRKVEWKCLGKTALTKGLEFNTVAILDKQFYTLLESKCKEWHKLKNKLEKRAL